MGGWTHRLPGMGDFLTTIADFRGWGVRGLAGVPRGVRDVAAGTLGVPKTSIFGSKLGPNGPHSDSNGLDCVKK